MQSLTSLPLLIYSSYIRLKIYDKVRFYVLKGLSFILGATFFRISFVDNILKYEGFHQHLIFFHVYLSRANSPKLLIIPNYLHFSIYIYHEKYDLVVFCIKWDRYSRIFGL